MPLSRCAKLGSGLTPVKMKSRLCWKNTIWKCALSPNRKSILVLRQIEFNRLRKMRGGHETLSVLCPSNLFLNSRDTILI